MASFRRIKLGLGLALLFGAGCALTDLASLQLMYRRVDIPESRVHRDLPYRDVSGEEGKKQRLDLYAPEGKNWPVLVFVHGGGWDSGDKGLKMTGDDIYGNIGRYFALQGVGTAVISYRLLPDVTWQEQIRDVAGAVAWVYRNIAKYGGDPRRLFLSGHSAGAQLATRVSLDAEPLKQEKLSKSIVSGVIAVSGAGYEIANEDVIATRGGRRSYYQKRFEQGDQTGAWQQEVSLLRFVDKTSPPFLILHGSAEPKSLIEQSDLLGKRLQDTGVPTKVVVVPHRDHIQMVMTISRQESGTTQEMLDFIGER